MPNLKKRSEDGASGQVLTFFSTASASGKTTLAINCASDLAERGYRVCLMDADMQFGDVTNCLKLENEHNIFHMYEDEEANAADLVIKTAWKFDVLQSPYEIDEAFLIDADITNRAINHLKANYDYVVVDLATGFTDISMGVLEKTDILFLLCVVDFIPTIKDLKVGLETLQRIHFDPSRVRLILNRHNAQTQISTKDVEALLGRKFDYLVANDYKVMLQSIKSGEPIVLSQKDSRVADDISAIMANEMEDSEQKEEKSGGFFSWLMQR